TFGTIDGTGKGVLLDRFRKPLTLISNTLDHVTYGLIPHDYQVNNSEVMSILLDEMTFHTPGGTPTVNDKHALNPKMKVFSKARRATSDQFAPPGIGQDLVYRDPWGNPYIITLDLGNSGVCT